MNEYTLVFNSECNKELIILDNPSKELFEIYNINFFQIELYNSPEANKLHEEIGNKVVYGMISSVTSSYSFKNIDYDYIINKLKDKFIFVDYNDFQLKKKLLDTNPYGKVLQTNLIWNIK